MVEYINKLEEEPKLLTYADGLVIKNLIAIHHPKEANLIDAQTIFLQSLPYIDQVRQSFAPNSSNFKKKKEKEAKKIEVKVEKDSKNEHTAGKTNNLIQLAESNSLNGISEYLKQHNAVSKKSNPESSETVNIQEKMVSIFSKNPSLFFYMRDKVKHPAIKELNYILSNQSANNSSELNDTQKLKQCKNNIAAANILVEAMDAEIEQLENKFKK